jgi:hypothetical protein
LKVLEIMSLRVRTPHPTTLRVRFVSYALGAHKLSMGRVVVETSKKAYSIGN